MKFDNALTATNPIPCKPIDNPYASLSNFAPDFNLLEAAIIDNSLIPFFNSIS